MTLRIRSCLVSVVGLIGLGVGLRAPQVGATPGQSYVVQANDTLSAIALRVHTSQTELMRLNGITDADRLLVGQVLMVQETGTSWRGDGYQGRSTSSASTSRDRSLPAGRQRAITSYPTQTAMNVGSETGAIYVVQPGDSLGALSNRFGVSISTLAALNRIDRPELLLIGQRLEIPEGAAATGSTIGAQTSSYIVPTSATPASTVSMTATEQSARPSVPATATPTTIVSSAGGMPSGSPAGTTQAAVGAILTAEAAAYGVDPALVEAVAWQESGWRMVTAPDGGIGVMQLMPATATWVGPALLGRIIDPNNVQDNIQAGVALLASYLRTYGGNVEEALAAYNAGPGNPANGIPSSTAQYISDVLSLRAGYAQ